MGRVILSIDTAMSACSLGLQLADGSMKIAARPMERGQAEALMPMVRDLLAENGIAPQAVDAYVVAIGPGAFAGLRIGLSAARTLSLVSGKPVAGATTLEALIHQAQSGLGGAGGDICAVVETKRDDFYVQVAGGTAACLHANELSRILAEKPFTVIGDANNRIKESCAHHNLTRFIDVYAADPASLVFCAGQYLDQLKQGVRMINTDPFYIRPPDVSASKQKKVIIAQ